MSQLNRNANYLYTIDGNTVWERLRVVRNFIVDRKLAIQVNELGIQKLEAKKEHYEKNKAEYSIDESYAVQELLLFEPQQQSNLADARRELVFLEDLEKTLVVDAEPLRISGTTDEQMYEINYFEELIQIHLLEVRAQLSTMGTLTSEMMRTLIRNKPTLDRAIKIGLIDKGIQEKVGLLPSNNIPEKVKLISDIKEIHK